MLIDTLPPLRQYQQVQYDYRRKLSNNQVMLAPTGSGKGNLIIRQVLDNIKQGISTLIIVPSEELLINLESRLSQSAHAFLSHCAFVSGSRKKDWSKSTLFVTYQTLVRNLPSTPRFDQVIFDECHLSSAPTALKCIQYYPKAIHTGYTATAGRMDNKPLDYIYQEINTCPLSVRELINQGYLADFVWYGLPLEGFENYMQNRVNTHDDALGYQQKYLTNKKVSNQIYANWKESAYGTKTIGFASGIEHAEMLTQMFNDQFSTKRFAFMHNGMKFKERAAVLRAFKNNDLLGIFNIDMLIMGVDVPDATTVLLCRSTKSTNLHRQQMGRILRPAKDKPYGIILDVVGNVARLGSPAFEKEYSLSADANLPTYDLAVTCNACGLAIAERSVFVRQIKQYWTTGKTTGILRSVGEVKQRDTSKGIYLETPATVCCNNCGTSFNKLFRIGINDNEEIEWDTNQLRIDNRLGKLQKLSVDPIDQALLVRQFEDMLYGHETIQKKRRWLLNSRYPLEYKYEGLQMLGETPEAAQLLLGIQQN